MIDPLHTQLASAVRSMKCECLDKEHWPWKREQKCRRCVVLEAFELRKAAADAAKEKK